MSFNKKTIKDIKLTDKRVLLRADYNLPAGQTGTPDIESDFRVRQSLPTIEYILSQNVRGLMIISHLGRPSNAFEKKYSLRPIAEHLSKLLGRKVRFVHDCVGDEVKEAVSMLGRGEIVMLENLRYHPEEEKNDRTFAKALVETTSAEVFVQDGFGVVHRAHASTAAVAKLLPAVAGLLIEKEVSTINQVMKEPNRPLVAIIGGAKIADKIEIINRFIELADCVALGGAMANNFLKVAGHHLGQSLYDKAGLDAAHDVLEKAEKKAKKQAFTFLLPVDAVVAKSMEGHSEQAGRAATRVVDLVSHALSDIQSYPRLPKQSAYTVGKDEAIYDIGPVSAGRIAGAVELAGTVIWNGTLGMAEVKGIAGAHAPFAHGSRTVAEAIIGSGNGVLSKPFSVVGGGDTASYLEAEGLVEDIDHVSTGGGAALELMAGHKLPGVEVLNDK